MKLVRWVGILASVALTALAAAQEARPVMTEDHAARLIKQSPAFTGAHADRKFSRILRLNYLQEGGQEGYGVDLEWVEGGKTRFGVAPIMRVPAGKEKEPWFHQTEGWGIAAFIEDKTFAELQALVKDARLKANEAAAVGDLRAVISAQIAYSMSNGSAYDELRCLAEPAQCLAGYTGPNFVDTSVTQSEKTGYRRKFHPGPKAPKAKDVKSASSITSFAMTAVPIRIGETGQRGFCADDRGIICFTADGSEPSTKGGQCADPCQALR